MGIQGEMVEQPCRKVPKFSLFNNMENSTNKLWQEGKPKFPFILQKWPISKDNR
jgi:hypothetical protein